MKKVIFFITVSAFLVGAVPLCGTASPELTGNEKYCAKMKDGQVVIMQNKAELTVDVTLPNGTMVKTNGEVIKKDGTKMVLKNGECVDHDGNMINAKNESKKDEPKMPVK